MTRLQLVSKLRELGFIKMFDPQDILFSYKVIQFYLYCYGLGIKHVKEIHLDSRYHLIVHATGVCFDTEYSLLDDY